MVRLYYTLISVFVIFYNSWAVQVYLNFDKEVFRIGEPIEVTFSVVNNDNTDFSFYLYDYLYKTFFFDVKSTKNYSPEYTFEFSRRHSFVMDVGKRLILLKPMESFSVKIDISKIYEFKEVGGYYIVGIFSPDGLADTIYGLSTQRYKIFLKPPSPVEEEIEKLDKEKVARKQQLPGLPPYEVVRRMLEARKIKNEEEYVLYFDFEKLISVFPSFSKRYNEALTVSEKLKVIERFKDYFVSYWGDTILSYDVKRTEIEGNQAKVVAEVEFALRNTSYKLRYTYSLYRSYDNIWYIYSYEAVNIK